MPNEKVQAITGAIILGIAIIGGLIYAVKIIMFIARQAKGRSDEYKLEDGFESLGNLTGKTVKQITGAIGTPKEINKIKDNKTGDDAYQVIWEKGRYLLRIIFQKDKVFDHIECEVNGKNIYKDDLEEVFRRMHFEGMKAEKLVQMLGNAYSRSFDADTGLWSYQWRSKAYKFAAEFTEREHEFVRVTETGMISRKKGND